MRDEGLRVDQAGRRGAGAMGQMGRRSAATLGRSASTMGRLALVVLLAGGLTACSWLRETLDPSNVDYKSAKSGPGLDVPPDLIGPRGDDRYVVPEAGRGKTYSDYSRDRIDQAQQAQQAQQQVEVATAAPSGTVLPSTEGARIERDGAMRWLVVDQPPERVWPQVVSFWEAEGMPLESQNPALGTMETEWVTRNERPERGGIRGVLSRAIGSTYTTSMKDAYRTRLERAPNGGTEIYVSQRALEEVVNSVRQDSTIWQPGPNQPDLEVEMLRRMMLRIGKVGVQESRDAVAASAAGRGTAVAGAAGLAATGGLAAGNAAGGAAGGGAAAAGSAAAALATAPASDRPELATVVAEQGGLTGLRVNEGYERAWREVGLAIDRIGFTVEDRDRSKGTYFVRYVDLDRRDPRQGALSRLFSGERKDLTGQRYQIRVEGDGNDASRVAVRSDSGAVPTGDADVRVANRIVALLHERIR